MGKMSDDQMYWLIQNLRRRLRQMEDSLHMALCIIENDAESPTLGQKGETRRRWVAEIEQESGIDRSDCRRRRNTEERRR